MDHHSFTFQQLRAFVTVAEELHFGRAADRLFISQPPLSRSIQSLERHLGVTLLDRTSRSVSLTPAGKVFKQHAASILAATVDAGRAAREAHSQPMHTIRMGYVEPMAFDLLPRMLARFRASNPPAYMELHELHSHEQIRALQANEIDVAIVRPPFDDHGLEVRHVFNDPLALAVREDHPLAGTTVSVGDLASEEFVTYVDTRGEGIQSAFIQSCRTAGFEPRISARVSSTPVLMSVLTSSNAVAMVSGELARLPRPGIRFLDIVGPEPLSPVAIVWRASGEQPAFGALEEALRRTAARGARTSLPAFAAAEDVAPRAAS